MLIKFISLGGYGFYVWPAFIFTFTTLLLFYIKTNKELQKQEKLYAAKFGEYKEREKEETREAPEQEEVFSNS